MKGQRHAGHVIDELALSHQHDRHTMRHPFPRGTFRFGGIFGGIGEIA